MYIEIQELKGSVYDLPDTECGNIFKELQSKTSSTARETAGVIIVEGYLVKNRYDSLSSTEGILADPTNSKYLILEGGEKIPEFGPRKLYITRNVMEKVFNYIDAPVCKADELYTKLEKVIQPYMWDTCGYSQESNAFDIVLAVKEIIDNLESTIDSKQKTIDEAKSVYGTAGLLDRLEGRIESKLKEDNTSVEYKATALWCAITNAISRKYKVLSEVEPKRALRELLNIEQAILYTCHLNELDIMREV